MKFDELKRVVETYGVVKRSVGSPDSIIFPERSVRFTLFAYGSKRRTVNGRSDNDLQAIINLYGRIRILMLTHIKDIEGLV